MGGVRGARIASDKLLPHFYGLAWAGLIFVIPAKAGIKRGRGACEPSQISEIKYEQRATNPFPIYGGRLGWG